MNRNSKNATRISTARRASIGRDLLSTLLPMVTPAVIGQLASGPVAHRREPEDSSRDVRCEGGKVEIRGESLKQLEQVCSQTGWSLEQIVGWGINRHVDRITAKENPAEVAKVRRAIASANPPPHTIIPTQTWEKLVFAARDAGVSASVLGLFLLAKPLDIHADKKLEKILAEVSGRVLVRKNREATKRALIREMIFTYLEREGLLHWEPVNGGTPSERNYVVITE